MPEEDKDNIIEKLQDEIAFLRNILERMPGNVYWKTTDDLYLGCNINNALMLNFSGPEAVVGKYGADFLPKELADKVRKADNKIIKGGKEVSFEEPGIDTRGKAAIYVSRKTPIYDKRGKALGILGISIDITKQKQMQKKLKKARLKAEIESKNKTRFLAMIGHEIRVPLTSLLGFVHFLQNEKITPQERQTYLAYLLKSGNYLSTLIHNILDYSKLDVNKINLSHGVVNLKELIQDVKSMLLEEIKAKNLAIYLEYDPNAPEKIIADKNILQQILINLVSNAIKFTLAGSIFVKVRCVEKKHDAAQLEIAVQDTGIGIPPDKQKKIFKPFYQVEDVYVRTSSISGAGLGLSIVKELVKHLGGKLRVQSQINSGSIFYFDITFPLKQKFIHTSKVEKLANNKTYPFPKGLHVLLIEDDPLVQIVHKKMLSSLACEVDVAENAVTALKMLAKPYHLIFADIGLPDLNGFDLIKEIRKQPDNARIPIVVITGFCSKEEKKRLLLAGADVVIVKPVSIEALGQHISQFIKPQQKM
jgi:two-component system, OmpR family, aerobic respiration control sensor histidine kinase ArcB